jgi:hypothetical protein
MLRERSASQKIQSRDLSQTVKGRFRRLMTLNTEPALIDGHDEFVGRIVAARHNVILAVI